jgi:hypothetical protein
LLLENRQQLFDSMLLAPVHEVTLDHALVKSRPLEASVGQIAVPLL